LRRITTPTTIYKKQKLDRDDIVDITDFNVVSWLKQEMRVMLDEEIARAILVGDGRDPVGDADNHINTANLRPIYTDDAVYVHNVQVALARTNEEMIDDLISARTEYRGSGNPTLYAAPSLVTAWLLLRDTDGYRMYKTKAELAAELGVKEIVEVPVMAGVQNDYTTPTHNLRAIIVNLADYTIGADRGGEINFFDDFDIDYNQYKYLIETRISGALVVPKSAITLEQAIA
jgi:HK97 family phage major capsid protein